MRRREIFLFCLFLLLPVGGNSATVIEMGGPRKVIVTLQAHGGGWKVEVQMLRVIAFDDVTNLKISSRTAQHYALAALVRHLQLAKATVKKITVCHQEVVNDIFKTSYIFDGVQGTPKTNNLPQQSNQSTVSK